MNLIAREYLAGRPDKTGVLILSEMAEQEQIRRNDLRQNRLRHGNVVRWVEEFPAPLSSIRMEGADCRPGL